MRQDIELVQNFLWVFSVRLYGKPEQSFWPTQYYRDMENMNDRLTDVTSVPQKMENI